MSNLYCLKKSKIDKIFTEILGDFRQNAVVFIKIEFFIVFLTDRTGGASSGHSQNCQAHHDEVTGSRAGHCVSLFTVGGGISRKDVKCCLFQN